MSAAHHQMMARLVAVDTGHASAVDRPCFQVKRSPMRLDEEVGLGSPLVGGVNEAAPIGRVERQPANWSAESERMLKVQACLSCAPNLFLDQ